MNTRVRTAALAASSMLAMFAAIAPSAHAGLLSLAPGSCGQQESQPFASYGDSNSYVLVPGGSFEAGAPGWLLTGGASVVSGGAGSAHSLSLPAGSSATSAPACTGLDHPSARLFVRNMGSTNSRLRVYGTYRLLLGLPYTISLGELSGSGTWQPSSPLEMGLLNNVLGSATLSQSTISFTFVPADNIGKWQIDNVYLDPFRRM